MKDVLLQSPVFAMAARQFDQVADFMELTDEMYSVLDALKKIENPTDDVKTATDQVEKMTKA